MRLQETQERLEAYLLSFVDFFYAVVFGFVLQAFYDEMTSGAVWQNKITSLLLVVSVFYFLTWDWMHGRALTIGNPYSGEYRRFFEEILIATLGYGALLFALQRSPLFIFFSMGIFLTGYIWAKHALRQYPQSDNRELLHTIQTTHSMGALLSLYMIVILYSLLGIKYQIGFVMATSLIFAGFSWFLYFEFEMMLEVRSPKEWQGPSVPFISRRRIRRFLATLVKAMRRVR